MPPQADQLTPGLPQPAGSEQRPRKLIELVFPQNPSLGFAAGIAISLVLLGLSLYVKTQVVGADTIANVLVALATAIVLAAFNGQATVQWGPLVLAGVAASFGALLYFLEHTDKERWVRFQQSYVVGSISGIPAGTYSAEFKRREAFWTNHIKNEIAFVALTSKFEGAPAIRLTMNVKDRAKVPFCKNRKPEEECEELVFDIPTELFRKATIDRAELQWRFNPNDATFVDIIKGTQLFGEQTSPRASDIRTNGEADLAHAFLRFLSLAAKAADDSSLRDALSDLVSDDTAARRAARDTLSEGPVEWVRPIIKHMRDGFSNYRIRLGCSVALAQMLRSEKSRSKTIQGLMTPEDIYLLLKAASDPDRTVRIYASEFLYDLGDPRTVLPALELAKSADDNGKYNLIFLSKSGAGFITDLSQKEATKRGLLELRPTVGTKTKALVDDTLAAIK